MWLLGKKKRVRKSIYLILNSELNMKYPQFASDRNTYVLQIIPRECNNWFAMTSNW